MRKNLSIKKVRHFLIFIFALSITSISHVSALTVAEVLSDPNTTVKRALQTLDAIETNEIPKDPKLPPIFENQKYYSSPLASTIKLFCEGGQAKKGDGWIWNSDVYDNCYRYHQASLEEEAALDLYYRAKTKESSGSGGVRVVTERDSTPEQSEKEKSRILNDLNKKKVAARVILGAADTADITRISLGDAEDALEQSGCPPKKLADEKLNTPTSGTKSCEELWAARDVAAGALATAEKELEETEGANNGECSAIAASTWFTYCLIDGIQYLLNGLLIGLIAGPIITLAGLLFDYSIYFSIIQFPEMLRTLDVDGAQTESSIYNTWVILRNLFNIIIVFQLLRIAIYKILAPVLGKSAYELKRVLSSIIIFTLFVNFSFFFTKALVDVSNITALQFYSGMGGSLKVDGKFTQGNIGIAIAEGLGINTGKILFVGDSEGEEISAETYGGALQKEGQEAKGFDSSITGVIILFCLLLLASFVLFQGAAIFISRSVLLIILLIFSPLMFAGGIIGFISEWSKKWWSMLMEQLFVAPLYLGMLFLTLKVAGDGQTYGLLTQLNTASKGLDYGYFGGIAAMIIQGAIMAGLFISAVKLAKEFGGAAAQKSSSFGARAYGAVVGGAGGAVLRRGLGGAANRFSNSQKWKDRAAGTGFGAAASRGLLTIADKGKNGTFDFRNSSALKGANGMAGKFGLGLDSAGAGSTTGGFVTDRAEAAKKKTAQIKKQDLLLSEDTYGMTEDQKKAAEMRNQDRIERYRNLQSIPYSGKETGGEHVGSSGEIQEMVKKIDELQSVVDSASSSLKSAELSRDPDKISKAKARFEKSKEELNEAIEDSNDSMLIFFDDKRTKDTDLAKLLENTEGLEEGPAKSAAVRKNLQRIADFKQAQEGLNPVINKALRGTQAAWTTATRSSSPMARSQVAWQSAAKDVRKETVRKRATQEAEDLLKMVAWNETVLVDDKPKKKEGTPELSAAKSKDEVRILLDEAIKAHKDKPAVASKYRGARNKLDSFYKKINEDTPGAADAGKPKDKPTPTPPAAA